MLTAATGLFYVTWWQAYLKKKKKDDFSRVYHNYYPWGILTKSCHRPVMMTPANSLNVVGKKIHSMSPLKVTLEVSDGILTV